MQFIGIYADYGTIFSMEPSNLESVLTAENDVVIKFIPSSQLAACQTEI